MHTALGLTEVGNVLRQHEVRVVVERITAQHFGHLCEKRRWTGRLRLLLLLTTSNATFTVLLLHLLIVRTFLKS